MKRFFKKLQKLPFAIRLYATFCFGILLAGLLLIIFRQYTQSSYLQAFSAQNRDFAAQVDTTGFYTESFLRNMANQIFYSRAVNKLRTYPAPTGTQQIEGVRELNSFSASSLIIDSIYLFNGQQEYVYSTESYGPVSDTMEAFRDQAAVELFRNRTQNQRLELFPRPAANSSRTGQFFSYMYYEVDSEGIPADNAIMFNLSANWITELFFSSYSGENAFILNLKGQIMTQREGADPLWLRELSSGVMEAWQGGTTSGYFIHTLSTGQKVVCFYAEMAQHNWCYVRPLDHRDCLGVLQDLGSNTFILVIIGFFSLAIIGVAAAMLTYVPYQRVARRIAAVDPGAEEDAERIMASLNRLIEENADSENLRRSLDETIRGQVLRNLLQQSHTAEDIQNELTEYHLRISTQGPLSLCLISGLRTNQYRAALEQAVPCEGTEIQNEHTVFFLQTDDPRQLRPILEQISKQHPSTYFFLSPPISQWEDLPFMYQQLAERYRMRFLHPKQRLHDWTQFQPLDSSGTELTRRKALILGHLRKGFYNKAEQEWEGFVAELDHKRYSVIRFSLIDLDNGVQKLLDAHAYVGESPAAIKPFKDFSSLLDNVTDIETLNGYFTERFRTITAQIQQERRDNRGNMIQNIMTACQEQFCDPQLSSQELARQFDLSVAYLSRIFRQSTGSSLMDYINTLRIQRAREILAQPGVLVKDVAGQVGIDNPQYFFKLFKQMTGVTPKQYQSQRLTQEGDVQL